MYQVLDVTNLPRSTDLGRADSLEAASKLAADHFNAAFMGRPYVAMSQRDHEQDGLDILAFRGLDAIQIAVNKVL